MIEIERKFLVTSDAYKDQAQKTSHIVQGFLNTDPERTVRVRIVDNEGILTVKGLSSDDGLKRFEWEKAITKTEAKALLDFCEFNVIDKVRYEVQFKEHLFEIDEFYGENEGLVIAELELKHENEKFDRPFWLGKEVTGKTKYYNSQLSKKPFKAWEN